MTQIFFFHAPKAGGTSLRYAIQASFPEAAISPNFDNDVLEHRALGGIYDSFKGYDVYAGHYGRDVYEALGKGHVCTTNFRHPVPRIVSLYNYFRSQSVLQSLLASDSYRAVSLAKRADLWEFVSSKDQLVNIYLENMHFRQLTYSPWSLDYVGNLTAAYRFIDAMPCYYICEFRELSLLWMQERLGVSHIPRENVTECSDSDMNVNKIDRQTVGMIMLKNQLDVSLYTHALNRLLLITADDIGAIVDRPPSVTSLNLRSTRFSACMTL